MANTYPYIAGPGAVTQIVTHLRKSFPATIDASTLKKLNIAPKNESYLISILRFLKIIDSEGKKTDAASKIFVIHDDGKFQEAFAGLVKEGYHDLFELHSEGAWKLDSNELISFFRHSDQSSSVVGGRQTNTFKTLSALSGFAEMKVQSPKVRSPRISDPTPKKVEKKVAVERQIVTPNSANAPALQSPLTGNFGLSVRVEVNLPASADQATYDKIFLSIRKNLIDGNA
jgi:hypothetical protein